MVLRLANLLWRLRRATTIETGLFEMQAGQLHEYRQARQITRTRKRRSTRCSRGRTRSMPSRIESRRALPWTGYRTPLRTGTVNPATDLARCLLRLANLPNFVLDRLSRYEAILWLKSAKPYSLTTRWIVASHKIEGAVSAAAAGQTWRLTGAMNFDYLAPSVPIEALLDEPSGRSK